MVKFPSLIHDHCIQLVLFLGILPLVFENPSDYDKIQPDDRVSILGLTDIAPGKVICFLFGSLSYHFV